MNFAKFNINSLCHKYYDNSVIHFKSIERHNSMPAHSHTDSMYIYVLAGIHLCMIELLFMRDDRGCGK